MEEEMKELMKNKEFLQSVLSTLPGVNPEQALLNLQEMTEASAHEEGEQGDDKMEEEKSENKASSTQRLSQLCYCYTLQADKK